MKFDSRFISIEDLIRASYYKDDFSIDSICSALTMSRTTLHRIIKKQTGLSTTHFVNHIRLNNAYDILTSEDTTIKDVAHRVGFRDPKYFSKLFKRKYGFLPSVIDDNEV